MTAFPYNEPAPTAGSWFWLCATCGRRDNTDLTKSVKTKLFVDDSGHSYTHFFSLLAKLVQFLPFPALRIHLGSQFIACGFLWWAGAVTGGNQVKKMIQVNTSFSAPLLLRKVQYVLVLEWWMRRGTMAQHRSVMLGGRQSYISWNSITSTPMDFSIAPSLRSTWQQMGLYWLSASQHVTRAFGTTASVRKPSCCLLLQNNTNNWL